MKAYDGAVKQLSGYVTSAEISTDVAIIVQLGRVQLRFVQIMLCAGRDLNRIVFLCEAGVRGVATFSFRCVPPRTMQG